VSGVVEALLAEGPSAENAQQGRGVVLVLHPLSELDHVVRQALAAGATESLSGSSTTSSVRLVAPSMARGLSRFMVADVPATNASSPRIPATRACVNSSPL